MPTRPSDSIHVQAFPTILRNVTLRVSDLQASTRFYHETIGLHVLERGSDTVWLGAGNGGVPLLRLIGDASAPRRPEATAGLFHIAFRLPNEAALADAFRRVNQTMRLTGAADHRISHALYLDDLEGNGLELYVDQPREAWPMGADGRLQLATGRLDLPRLNGLPGLKDGTQMPAGTDIGHLHLEGVSARAQAPFHREVLGLDVTVDQPRLLFTSEGGYHHHLGVNTWSHRSRPRQEGTLGLDHIELALPGRSLATLEEAARNTQLHTSAEGARLHLRCTDNLSWTLRPT